MKITEILSLKHRINMLGIIGAVLFLYICFSNQPWWTLAGGMDQEQSFSAKISPFTFEAQILNKPLTIPITPYLNLAAKLTMLLTAATIFIGSLLPTKPWSKPMISIRGLTLPIIFLLGIFVSSQLAKSIIGITIPITGNFTVNYSINYNQLTISTQTPCTATLTLEYYIALAAGAIALLARILQGRILGSTGKL
jgi:hypothetical protein